MQITPGLILECYNAAKRVVAGELAESSAIKDLAEVGMNPASASIYVRCLRHLLVGEVFSRTISAPAAKFYLENIRADFGEDAFLRALQSVELHIAGYNALGKGKLVSLAKLVGELRDDLEVSDSAFELSKKPFVELLAKAANAPKMPNIVATNVLTFVRSKAVAAARLAHANGICEECAHPAPFLRRGGGEPYLEIHHRVRLADGGPDTFENTIALCPNCHRKAHFG